MYYLMFRTNPSRKWMEAEPQGGTFQDCIKNMNEWINLVGQEGPFEFRIQMREGKK